MKSLLSSCCLILIPILSSVGQAQVNLDQRINVDRSHVVCASTNEPNIAYVMPNSLSRVSDVTVVHVGPRVLLQFDVGIPATEFAQYDALLAQAGKPNLKSAVIRALDASMVENSILDIPSRFAPQVMVAGDMRNFMGPVRYALSVKNIVSRGQNQTAKMLATLFSSKGVDDIGQVAVTFSAVALGAPYLGRTAVPVMVGAHDGAAPLNVPNRGLSSMALADIVQPLRTNALMLADGAPLANFQLVQDSIAGCWDHPKPGVICLK